ncbi:acyltransferase family protein [Rhizobium multihospitium]|uniref:Peptidoglycan/LPS O-acetylase OafA/YrhL, contains acyltransferase and SGNH-hydrolase domains n=1 Tax=Rhizobium multihospitium TaxID=410764 RepID=A0A1C3U606_9HYPH|nr:acyltransferase [Rhizobium multihospitium]SCB10916.1 Peptidoglycan/LPS O-acetylase OafA/YrhL, contains acyltransferase and SGNH-hydrolase domains [Rhizobium multihospitium]
MPADATRHRYAALDAMRGLAAFAVVVYHLDRPYAPSAYIAVDFFFVLSGFVIARAYGEKLASGMTVLAFMKARYARLYPLFLIGSVYGLVQLLLHWQAAGVGRADLAASILTTVFMLPSPSFLTRSAGDILALYPLNGPAWSLFWELLANLVFALLLFRLKTRSLILIAAASLAMLIGSVFLHKSLDLGWEWHSVDGGFARVFFSFTLGMIIYRLRGETTLGRTVNSYAALLPIAAILALLFLPTYSLKYALVFCILISPLIVLAGTMLELPERLQRLGIFLGYLSYPIYMCHRGFTEIYGHLMRNIHLPQPVYIAIYLVAISIVALISARLATILVKYASPWRDVPKSVGATSSR